MRNIIFTGGGTAGHVFPGLAVARRLQQSVPCTIYWLGTRYGMERSIIRAAGIRFLCIPAGKLRRYFSLWNIVDLFTFVGGIIYSLVYLFLLRPKLLFSKGGFVSVPPVLAARILGIPSVTHESDYDPGLATKINAKFCNRVLTSFRDSGRYFSGSAQKKLIYSGNPVRPEIEQGDTQTGRSLLGCPAGKKMVLVLGGSLGAAEINTLIEQIIGELEKDCFVVHQVGRRNPLPRHSYPHYRAFPFIGPELPHFLAAADLVISRAGANTLWELAVTGTPAVLVPLGTSGSRGDQLRNAEIFKKAGAAVVLRQETITGRKLLETIKNLLDNGTDLKNMARAAANLGVPHATERIARILIEMIGENHNA
jgi:UDP-N-acetylglucosamine--N-acetylmuramyl-(pentapeptide) pyrophosphoryl-undecaprenol N-acetylglucosamine transferase